MVLRPIDQGWFLDALGVVAYIATQQWRLPVSLGLVLLRVQAVQLRELIFLPAAVLRFSVAMAAVSIRCVFQILNNKNLKNSNFCLNNASLTLHDLESQPLTAEMPSLMLLSICSLP